MTNRILRLPKVLDRTGISRAQIYVLMKTGKFPKAIQLSERAVGWLESDVRDWIDERTQVR